MRAWRRKIVPVIFKILFPILLLILSFKILFPLIFFMVIYGVALFFVTLPLMYNNTITSEQTEYKGYMYLLSHALLYILTFGIWQLVWVYRTTKFANDVFDEDKIEPILSVVLCLFVPYYMVCWSYKVSTKIDAYAQKYGLKSSIAKPCLILSIFDECTPTLLIQNKLNEVVCAKAYVEKGIAVDKKSVNGFASEYHLGLLEHFILSWLTFGVWEGIWIYRTTIALNEIEGEKCRNPLVQLLLCVFIPFYVTYWYYKTAKSVDNIALTFSIDSDLKVVAAIFKLVFFVGSTSSILVQDKINEIISASNSEN